MTMLAVCAIVESYGRHGGDYYGHVGNNEQKFVRDTGDYQVSSYGRNESDLCKMWMNTKLFTTCTNCKVSQFSNM